MKHIKRFNEELSPRVYKSAAKKLKALGHNNRADELIKHGESIVEREEEIKWKKRIEEYKDFGVFKLTILTDSINPKVMMRGDFYLDIEFDELNFTEAFSESKEEDSNNFKFDFMFHIGIIPVDEHTLGNCKRNLPEPDFYNGFFWAMSIKIECEVVGAVLKFTDITMGDYDTSLSGVVKLSDRRSANTFKNLFYRIFSDEADYPSGYTDIVDMHDKIQQTCSDPDIELISEYNFDMQKMADFIRSYPVNKLYSEI